MRQEVHVMPPVLAKYVPAAQLEHELEPDVENFPAVQEAHEVEEGAAEKVPAAQLEQTAEPANANELAVHEKQLDKASAPVTPYVPPGQLMQVDMPVMAA